MKPVPLERLALRARPAGPGIPTCLFPERRWNVYFSIRGGEREPNIPPHVKRNFYTRLVRNYAIRWQTYVPASVRIRKLCHSFSESPLRSYRGRQNPVFFSGNDRCVVRSSMKMPRW